MPVSEMVHRGGGGGGGWREWSYFAPEEVYFFPLS